MAREILLPGSKKYYDTLEFASKTSYDVSQKYKNNVWDIKQISDMRKDELEVIEKRHTVPPNSQLIILSSNKGFLKS